MDAQVPFKRVNEPYESEAEVREVEWIRARKHGTHHNKIAMQLGFPDRFQAKLALGIGHTVLGSGVTFSPYGDELRNLLWSKDYEKRGVLKLFGTGWWHQDKVAAVDQLLSFKGAWVVALTAISQAFGLMVVTPSGRAISMMVSDDRSLWQANIDPSILKGCIYLFVPQKNLCVGPISLVSFIAHKNGSQMNAELSHVESLRVTMADLPPKGLSAQGVS